MKHISARIVFQELPFVVSEFVVVSICCRFWRWCRFLFIIDFRVRVHVDCPHPCIEFSLPVNLFIYFLFKCLSLVASNCVVVFQSLSFFTLMSFLTHCRFLSFRLLYPGIRLFLYMEDSCEAFLSPGPFPMLIVSGFRVFCRFSLIVVFVTHVVSVHYRLLSSW